MYKSIKTIFTEVGRKNNDVLKFIKKTIQTPYVYGTSVCYRCETDKVHSESKKCTAADDK